jgi:hypothetical protein
VLADVPLTRLRYLTLFNGHCGAAGVRAVTASRHLTQLVTLALERNDLTDDALEALAAWPHLASVRALNLDRNPGITGTGIEALVRSPHFHPEHLQLEHAAVGDVGARALAGWPGLARLITLDLSSAGVSDAGGRALADSPHARALRHLKLTDCTLAGATIERLRARFGLALDTMP